MLNTETIQQLTNIVIRPHREIYTFDKLGPRKIIVKSVISGRYIQVMRKEATLINQGKKLQLSLFQPELPPSNDDNKLWHSPTHKKQSIENFQYKSTIITPQDDNPPNQAVIFLHSNSGSRLEGLQYIKYLLQYNHNVCLFDYSGSGLSEGQYVTMGINEAQDLRKVVGFLRERYGINQFGLWGRSMGAVTAIIYASLQPFRVSKMVLDSPFSNFRQLVKEIVNSRTGLPDFLFGSIIDKIEEEVILKTSHNLMDIDVRKNIKEKGMNQIKCMFLISKDDQLVKPTHVEILHSLHEGPKDLIYLEGSHNKPRPHDIREKCAQFLCVTDNLPSSKYQPVSLASHRRGSESGFNISTKNKKVVESIIISQSTQSSKQIHNSPKSFTKMGLDLNKLSDSQSKGQMGTIPTTQRDDQSLSKLSSTKVSLSQLKRNINSGYLKNQNKEEKKESSKIMERKDEEQASKEEKEIKFSNFQKNSMMATKYKNRFKEQLKKH